VAEALVARGARVTFAGSPARIEAQLVPEAGFELDAFEVTGLPRRPGTELARALVRSVAAVRECGRILARRRPDVVLGAGGYVAGPMALAAWRRRIPAALTEADAHLGLANRLAAPLAQRVFLAYPLDGKEPPKYSVVGRPIPARSRPVPRSEARRLFELSPDGPALLVAGALAGARALNEWAVETYGDAGPPVLHLSGERDIEAIRPRVRRADYRLLASTTDFGAALAACDLAVARAGSSVWEFAAAGLPTVLVPYPHATADHQTKNARYFERGGGAVVVPQAELARLPDIVESLLDDSQRLGRMCEAMRTLARPNAAEEIAEELISLAAA
jgi:UDP-N-acetylglucosamine--N-acetylmuramyl-(pentapeptide) pyrophosphoryl-undecaprenol N-acetylglucosamine transferase